MAWPGKYYLNPLRILHAGEYLGWLGISSGHLRNAFRARGARVKSFSNGVLNAKFPSSKEPTRYDSQLLEIARYPVSIDSEKMLEEARDESELFEHWLGILRAEFVRIQGCFDAFNPHAVILVQGYEPANAIARLIAVERDIPMIALENTAIKDRMLWDDQSGITTNRNLAKNFFWRFERSILDGREQEFIARLIAETKGKKQDEHASPDKRYAAEKQAEKKTVLFLGQVYTDSSVLFGSAGWSDPVEAIADLAAMSKELGFRLIVKLHPKEIAGHAPVSGVPYAKLSYRKLSASAKLSAALADGAEVMIDHENEYDTYSLIASADLAVTMNSQAGLEAAIRGITTVICGDAFYGNLGFTLEALAPHLLRLQIEKGLKTTPAEAVRLTELAQKFAYIYFEKYCVLKTAENLTDLVFRRCLGQGKL